MQAIDEQRTVALAGNVRPEAVAANDRGAVADGFALDHMQLLLKRAPATEAALQRFMDSQYVQTSPNFHQWLTAAEFGRRFGPADADLQKVQAWLSGHGFTVNGVSAGRTMIDFSGDAAEIRGAFKTEIHQLDVAGVKHIGNMSAPHIPAALSDVVAGIVSLSDFRPHPMFKPRPHFTTTNGYQAVAPADLETIYNFKPVFTAGVSGQGQTIVVIEDTDIYSTNDFKAFRKTFGLATYAGRVTQVHPSGSMGCNNPGVVAGNEGEAELDMEWASAAAPSAAIQVVSCADTVTTFGGLIAFINLIDAPEPPEIVSISYGECEAELGATANASYVSAYQQAAAEGISVFVSSGDEGAASCDADRSNATHGVGVSGFASTPYNVAVGGTDYSDTYSGMSDLYWRATNNWGYASAKSYIPEIPWNDSCASLLIYKSAGYATGYGSGGFCNSTEGEDEFLTTASGSGGPSGCATGQPKFAGVVSGSCAGTPKPSWQSVAGNPADGVRDIPDVSLFAANGVWNHYYVYCDSDTADGGVACTGDPSGWSGAGGTSFSSPIMAGVQALINQQQGSAQGNPNPVYYRLAAGQPHYGETVSQCTSTKGRGTDSACIFYDVSHGDIDVNCTGGFSCYRPSGTYGSLSNKDGRAFSAVPGWDFATGIGTVNVANLVSQWSAPQATRSRIAAINSTSP